MILEDDRLSKMRKSQSVMKDLLALSCSVSGYRATVLGTTELKQMTANRGSVLVLAWIHSLSDG